MRNVFARSVQRLLAAALAMLLAAPLTHAAQPEVFASPEAAAAAFGDAVMTSDTDTLKAILGNDASKYIPPVSEEATTRFLAAWAKSHKVVSAGEGKALIEVGTDGWTLPIPIVKTAAGWRFDAKAGAEEMRVRRIGRNEGAAIKVVLAIFDAEREYATHDWNHDGLLDYATKLASSSGKKDGLYWAAKGGEPASPLGPLVAEAKAAGHVRGSGYHGYHYRILTGQGGHAPGGAYDYLVRGHMIGGFAILAWPVKYGDTGVMTFMVSHAGVVYQKNLGANTAQLARAIHLFDPDPSWTVVERLD